MDIYFLALIYKVIDPSTYSLYIDKVRPIIERFGGEYVIRSEKITSISGIKPERILLLKFPDKEALQRCFQSPEYKTIAPLREKSTTSQAIIIEEEKS